MSYDFYAWRGETPTDDKQAWAELESLMDRSFEHLGKGGKDMPPSPTMLRFHDQLVQLLPEWAGEGEEPEKTWWSSGPLLNEFSGDVAMLPMPYTSVDEAYPVLLDVAKQHGVIIFNSRNDIVHRGDGFSDLTFAVEGEDAAFGVTEEAMKTAISRLNHRDPSFVILDRTDGSYAQALGGEKGCVAEIRVNYPTTFEHFSVCRFGVKDGPQVQVDGSNGGVKVPEGDRLSKDQALRALLAFARNEALPSDLALRNTTAEFMDEGAETEASTVPTPAGVPSAAPLPPQQAAPSQSTPAQPSPPGLIARIRSLFGL